MIGNLFASTSPKNANPGMKVLIQDNGDAESMYS